MHEYQHATGDQANFGANPLSHWERVRVREQTSFLIEGLAPSPGPAVRPLPRGEVVRCFDANGADAGLDPAGKVH
mgnify:CR=1 FL=1